MRPRGPAPRPWASATCAHSCIGRGGRRSGCNHRHLTRSPIPEGPGRPPQRCSAPFTHGLKAAGSQMAPDTAPPRAVVQALDCAAKQGAQVSRARKRGRAPGAPRALCFYASIQQGWWMGGGGGRAGSVGAQAVGRRVGGAWGVGAEGGRERACARTGSRLLEFPVFRSTVALPGS